MKIEDLKQLKTKLENAKTKRAKAEWSLEESKNKLKNEFGCETIEEAVKKLNQMQSEIDADEQKLEDMLNEIQKLVDWDSI